MTAELYWLPKPEDFQKKLAAAKSSTESDGLRLVTLRRLSIYDLNLAETASLDRLLTAIVSKSGANTSGFQSLKIAVLASSTVEHLLPGIRVAALRRGLLLEFYLGPYGQYRQELLNPASGFYTFKPDIVWLAIDADAALPPPSFGASLKNINALIAGLETEWTELWALAKKSGAAVVQQNMVVPPLRLFGHFDLNIPFTRRHVLERANQELARLSQEHGVLIFDLDALAAHYGKSQWCRPRLWHHAKQAVSPAYAMILGDEFARILAAVRGLSKKCLVLDLDDTLWGGTVGDVGPEGIELGQGSGTGEAFLSFQKYLKQLSQRGVILAACSKNEEKNARAAFQENPEMFLRLEDFAVFMANWQDKAANLAEIAARLNIGLDSLVFFDNDAMQRGLVRARLPEVAVPEVPEDPSDFASCLSDAGYFEAVAFTEDDLKRSGQYTANAERARLQSSAASMEDFLKSLNMRMNASPFDMPGLPRIVQLINKSNQFNLTTRRYTEDQVRALMQDKGVLTFQARLEDVYGDNGMISVVILKPLIGKGKRGFLIDTWLMSCRVLERQVEQEMLNLIAARARERGAQVLLGEFIPTPKNGLVKDHYHKLNFAKKNSVSAQPNGAAQWELNVQSYVPRPTHIQLIWKDSNL